MKWLKTRTRDRCCDDCYDSCSSSSLISCCDSDDESLSDCCCPWLLSWCCGSSGCFQEGFRGVVWCCGGCVCQRRSHGIWEFEGYKCGVVGKRLKSRLGWAAWMVVDFR